MLISFICRIVENWDAEKVWAIHGENQCSAGILIRYCFELLKIYNEWSKCVDISTHFTLSFNVDFRIKNELKKLYSPACKYPIRNQKQAIKKNGKKVEKMFEIWKFYYINVCYLEGHIMMSKIQPPWSKNFIFQTFSNIFSREIFLFWLFSIFNALVTCWSV